MDVARDLLRLKEKIEEAKLEKAQLEGKLQSVIEDLEAQYSTSDDAELKELQQQLSDQKEKLEKELTDGITTLDGLVC